MTFFGTSRPLSSLALLGVIALLISGCAKSGMSGQKVTADGLTGAANPDGLAYTAFGPAEDLQQAAEGLSDQAQGLSLSPEGIRWISIKQTNESQRMELTVRYRTGDGKVTPVRFEGAVLPAAKGKRAVLLPVRSIPTTTQGNTASAPSTTKTAAAPQVSSSTSAIPDVSRLEVECSDPSCSKAEVSFMNDENQKIAAAIVREQVVQADAQFLGEDAPLSEATPPAEQHATVPLLTRSVEVVGGRTAVQVREQGKSQNLLLSGDVVQTNGGSVPLHSYRPGIRGELVGNSQEGDIVIALERVPSTPSTTSDRASTTSPQTPPPATAVSTRPIEPALPRTRPTTTTPQPPKTPVLPVTERTRSGGGPTTRSGAPATAAPAMPAATTTPRPPTQPALPSRSPQRTYLTIGNDRPTVGGLPRFDFCPVVPSGQSNAAKAIRDSCEFTFWTSRPEYNMSIADLRQAEAAWNERGGTSRTRPELGAKYFYGLPKELENFGKFLRLFTGQSEDSRQSPFNRLAELIRQASLSLAWAFVPYVETKFAIDSRPVSYAGAAGTFQFMPATGRRFGLSSEDRFVFAKAAPAAVQYFSILNNHQQNDFLLAVASYNRGEGGVDRDEEATENHLGQVREKLQVMNQHVGIYTSDWWKILYFNMAPKQTQHYVVRIVTGAIYGLNPQKYGINAEALRPDAL